MKPAPLLHVPSRRFRTAGAAAIILLSLLTSLIALLVSSAANAWDSETHREIVRLAIGVLPPSPMRDFFKANSASLQRLAVEPDSLLKRKFGKSEEIRHYINIEYFGADPFAAIVPDKAAMEKRFGASTVRRAGTLPWTIVDLSTALQSAWSAGQCGNVLTLAGYLAHYVGDASQPLHSTIRYDGYRRDRGIHARVEMAVDHQAAELGAAAAGEAHLEDIATVWAAAIAEIRDANSHVEELIQADRTAREQSKFDRKQYTAALMSRERPMIAAQLARAASVLASIWLYEWKRAGSPSRCAAGGGAR